MTKERVNLRLERELVQRARNAISSLPAGFDLTLTSMVEDGLERVVRELEAQHNKGKPFPPFKEK